MEPSRLTEFHVFVSDGVLFERHGVTGDTRYVVPLDGCALRWLLAWTPPTRAAGASMGPASRSPRAGEGAARALYVDGVDREVAQVTDPTRLRLHARIYGPALAEAREGMGFDSATGEAAVSALDARDYDVVVRRARRDLDPATRHRRRAAGAHTAIPRGRRLIVSGAEPGWTSDEAATKTPPSSAMCSVRKHLPPRRSTPPRSTPARSASSRPLARRLQRRRALRRVPRRPRSAAPSSPPTRAPRSSSTRARASS